MVQIIELGQVSYGVSRDSAAIEWNQRCDTRSAIYNRYESQVSPMTNQILGPPFFTLIKSFFKLFL